MLDIVLLRHSPTMNEDALASELEDRFRAKGIASPVIKIFADLPYHTQRMLLEHIALSSGEKAVIGGCWGEASRSFFGITRQRHLLLITTRAVHFGPVEGLTKLIPD